MIEAIEELKNSGTVTVDEDHDWGYQLIPINNGPANYCGKFLVLTNFTPGSFHRHPVKDETFVVLCGEVFIRGEKDRCLHKANHPGNVAYIPSGIAHEMQAKSLPCIILEVSTFDDSADIEYMVESDNAK